VVLPLPFVSCEESYLFVSLCAANKCGMTDIDEDRGRSRRHGADDQGWSSTCRVLGARTIERLGDTVCGLHRT
jgi:hypothetical protein